MQPQHGGMHRSPGLPPPPSGSVFFEEVRHSIFLFASVILFSILLAVRERMLKAEKASHEAELSYLKAQINPHFLFNSLNNIYSLALAKDDAAPDAIIRLSEMMRYITRSGKEDNVPLENEIYYITNYIALQKIRFQDTVAIDYLVTEMPAGKRIAPLILICFIENAFKHGVNSDNDPVITIRLEGNETGVSLYVFNKKTGTVRNDYEKGIGLDNTRSRLDMLYPGRYKLAIDDAQDTFTVNLTMDLA
jgi:LytS/YehU family sensor histidine kinase